MGFLRIEFVVAFYLGAYRQILRCSQRKRRSPLCHPEAPKNEGVILGAWMTLSRGATFDLRAQKARRWIAFSPACGTMAKKSRLRRPSFPIVFGEADPPAHPDFQPLT